MPGRSQCGADCKVQPSKQATALQVVSTKLVIFFEGAEGSLHPTAKHIQPHAEREREIEISEQVSGAQRTGSHQTRDTTFPPQQAAAVREGIFVWFYFQLAPPRSSQVLAALQPTCQPREEPAPREPKKERKENKKERKREKKREREREKKNKPKKNSPQGVQHTHTDSRNTRLGTYKATEISTHQRL